MDRTVLGFIVLAFTSTFSLIASVVPERWEKIDALRPGTSVVVELNGVLIGAGIGPALGAISFARERDPHLSKGAVGLGTAARGAGIGLAIDAFVLGRTTLYRAKTSQVRVNSSIP